MLQPDQQHPLPSYLEYKTNSSVKSYQTAYFPSHCAEGPDVESARGRAEGFSKAHRVCDGQLMGQGTIRTLGWLFYIFRRLVFTFVL
jgi:hypothetical protein